jgi:hypothetical protein
MQLARDRAVVLALLEVWRELAAYELAAELPDRGVHNSSSATGG